MAVTVVVTPVLQKAEKCRFYQEIGGCYKGTIILKNSVLVISIPFNCIFVRLEKAHICEEKNECEISLALYTCLKYNYEREVKFGLLCYFKDLKLIYPELMLVKISFN